jgi:perosamine synthetase
VRLNIPLLGDEELAGVRDVLDSGFLTQGPRAAEFETLVRSYVGSAFGFATSSATTGIQLALDGVGVKPGEEVIVPDFSFPATANAVIAQGAVPVFVDIDLATFNMDPLVLEAAVTSKTAAIMPVHAFGLCADMDPINDIASRHGIPVIEDAACALSGSYKGRQAGSLSTAGVFSFHPRKIITTGEGGMIVTDDPEVARKVQVLRTHGAVRGELYLEFVEAGYNYRLSDVQAAIGIAQMHRIDHIVSRRQEVAHQLDTSLADVAGVWIPVVPAETTHSYQSYVVLLDADVDRDQVIRLMKERDIETTLGTYSMHLQPYFRERFGIADEELPAATRAQHSALTLPLYPQLTDVEVERIAETLDACVNAARVVRS